MNQNLQLLCPLCNNSFKLHKGPFGLFYGCNGWPECGTTIRRNFSQSNNEFFNLRNGKGSNYLKKRSILFASLKYLSIRLKQFVLD